VVVEGLSQAEAARRYGVSKSFVSRLVVRYRVEGERAFEPRSRRPLRSPAAIDPGVVERIVNLRVELAGKGLDAGPATIAWHLDAAGVTVWACQRFCVSAWPVVMLLGQPEPVGVHDLELVEG
jgi:Helix-turn-helix domain